MTSFGEQLRAAKTAHNAASLLERQAREDVREAFESWARGEISAQAIRHRLERIVRTSYRTSAAVATNLAMQQSGINGWRPQQVIFSTDYLAALLEDVRSNLRIYKASSRTQVDLRRAMSRIGHSAGVAAQRGYTDALVASYEELEDFGYNLRKLWLANFIDNDPCDHCRKLHGTEVGLREEFPSDQPKTKIYHNLLGPPRHPNCKCYLCILVVTLENAFEDLDIDEPTPQPAGWSTADIKKLPKKIFDAVVGGLRATLKFLRRKK